METVPWLQDQPNEVLHNIVHDMDPKSLVSLSLTCRRMHQETQDEIAFFRKKVTEFAAREIIPFPGTIDPVTYECDWKWCVPHPAEFKNGQRASEVLIWRTGRTTLLLPFRYMRTWGANELRCSAVVFEGPVTLQQLTEAVNRVYHEVVSTYGRLYVPWGKSPIGIWLTPGDRDRSYSLYFAGEM